MKKLLVLYVLFNFSMSNAMLHLRQALVPNRTLLIRNVWPPAGKYVKPAIAHSMRRSQNIMPEKSELVIPEQFIMDAFKCDCTTFCKIQQYNQNIAEIKKEMDATSNPAVRYSGPFKLALNRCAQDLLAARCKGVSRTYSVD
ncbi:MAG TPA: hypothetical protein VFF04_06085 [Candidatus Babeliales bacterium]|nr:hypothetical protein [Candidatus Babeliales bacterium]